MLWDHWLTWIVDWTQSLVVFSCPPKAWFQAVAALIVTFACLWSRFACNCVHLQNDVTCKVPSGTSRIGIGWWQSIWCGTSQPGISSLSMLLQGLFLLFSFLQLHTHHLLNVPAKQCRHLLCLGSTRFYCHRLDRVSHTKSLGRHQLRMNDRLAFDACHSGF